LFGSSEGLFHCIAKKIVPYHVDGATLQQMPVEVIQYPLTANPEGYQYRLPNYQDDIGYPLINMSHFQKLSVPFDDFDRGLPAPFDILKQICQKFSSIL
jgi:hypothetical protein